MPEDVSFQTKAQQAVAMLEHAWQHGVPMCWVIGDEADGDATVRRDTVIAHRRWYVLAVNRKTPVWTEPPALEAPQPPRAGRPRARTRLAEEAPPAITVHTVALGWPESRCQCFVVAEGEWAPPA